MNDYYSSHAKKRAQQRAIPPLVVDWLIAFGQEVPDKRGCSRYFFDKASKRRLKKAVGREPVKRMKDKLNSYAVVGPDGCVITAGPRTRRVRRN